MNNLHITDSDINATSLTNLLQQCKRDINVFNINRTNVTNTLLIHWKQEIDMNYRI